MSAPTEQKPEKRSFSDLIYDGVGALLPGCATALDLVEKGIKRPLTRKERFILFYNSPLCLHCNCNREKFDLEREKLRKIDEERRKT